MAALPRELVSLVHHVQLNQSGWWDVAVERLVLAALWRAGGPIHPEAITRVAAHDFGVRLPPGSPERAAQRLISRDDVLALEDGRVKLPELRMAEYEAKRSEGERRELHVKDRFRRALEETGCSCDAERTWQLFQEKWLQPTVAAAGARTYELVAGAPEEWVSAADIGVFTEALPDTQREAAREAVAKFFDPADTILRGYLLALMDAYFVVEAGGLSKETITAINELTAKHPRFVVFLDTNTIFSMLGLHGAVAKEASRGVFRVAEEVGRRSVVVKLYVTPQTLEEATSVLEYELERLSKLRIMPNMAGEILAHGTMTGVHLALVEAVQEAGRPVRAEDFLGPYVRGLKTILGEQGVDLYNDSMKALVEDEAVREDVEDQFRYENAKYKGNGKPRGALRHDVMLWHFVQGKRPPRVDSPSDAHYWILTEDRRYASFDAHKRRHRGVPVCLHPLAFAQVLEFWNGRTDDTAAALVGGLRLAMLTPQLGVESERTTLAIIAALSRWEGVEDLPRATIAHLLLNDALRQKLVDARDSEAEFALVRDELMAEHQRVIEAREQESERAAALEQQLELGERSRRLAEDRASELVTRAATLEAALDDARRLSTEKDARLEALGSTVAGAAEREKDLTERLDVLAKRLDDRERLDEAARVASAREAARRRFVWVWVGAPVAALVAAGVVLFHWGALDHTFWGDPRVDIGVLTLLGAAWAWAAHRKAETLEATKDWWLKPVLAFTRWALGVVALAGLGVGIVGNALYDRSGLKPTTAVPPLGTMSRPGDTDAASHSSSIAGQAPNTPSASSAARDTSGAHTPVVGIGARRP